MSTPQPDTARFCQVLVEDPGLADVVPAPLRDQALRECTAPTLRIARGRPPAESPRVLPDGIGMLVLEGLLIRRVGVEGRFGAELLGVGDLLRPWQGPGAGKALISTTGWRVLEPTRMAVLDRRVAGRFARYPELTGSLVSRALDRSRSLAVNMAIVHHPRVELRLLMLFWHLADRWGRVRKDGVFVPLRLSHSVLADLVAASRPTVSGALGELGRRGVISTIGRGWLIAGEPPGELLELETVEPGLDVSPGDGDDDREGRD